MALKAGYTGVKKSMLGFINSLASAKLIKSIGSGLKLSTKGALSTDIDTETMEYVNGKLSAKIPTIEGITMDILYGSYQYTNPASTDSSIELSESYEDYDFLYVIAGFTGNDNSGMPLLISVDMLKETGGTANRRAVVACTGTQFIGVSKGPDTTHLSMAYAQGCGVFCVVGIKF